MQFDFATIPAQDRYKLIVSTIVPRPIAWVVTQAPDGGVNAAPFSFFNALSGDPPIIAIGIGGRDEGGAKDTAANIRTAKQFVVNLVSEETAQAMVVTAIDFPPGVNEVVEAGLTTIPSVKVAPPRIAESPVAFECETFQTIPLPGDRDLVLARVLMVHIIDEAVMDPARCYIDTPKLNLVGRMHGRGWYSRTGDQFELPRIPLENWKKAAE